jgi:hypothetical protein
MHAVPTSPPTQMGQVPVPAAVPVSTGAGESTVGRDVRAGVIFHGFLKTPEGALTALDVLGSFGTWATGINAGE